MPAAPDPFQAHLSHASALFDTGDVVQAGQIWQAILKRDPAHQEAREGLYRVKRALDQKHSDDPRRDWGPAFAASDPARLVTEGVQLFDMGMEEEAIVKWRRALELDPRHQDAAKYLELALREQGPGPAGARQPGPARPPAPAPAPPGVHLETRLWRAEQMLRDLRLDEAVQAFQRLLDQGAGDKRILAGYHQARALLAARDEPRPALPAETAAPVPAPAKPVGPPEALLARAPMPRDGLRMPVGMKAMHLPRGLRSPRKLMLAFSVSVLALLGLVLYGVRRREAALKEAVAAAEQSALKPVSRMVQIPSLVETPGTIRREAEAALADDPLLAYFRAQEWRSREPDELAAAQLVQQAREKLMGPPPPVSAADFDRLVQSGNLEGARGCILQLLRHDPDDPDLRGRARKVLLALTPLYVEADKMDKAREALRLGLAMFPQDLTWPARLKLLEAIQAMPKSGRAPWIQLLE